MPTKSYEQYTPRRPSYPPWDELGPTGGPADPGQDFIPLDGREQYWVDLNKPRTRLPWISPLAIDLAVRHSGSVASELAPPSAELVAANHQAAIDAVYDEAVADDRAYNAARANILTSASDEEAAGRALAEARILQEAHATNDALDREYHHRARHRRLGATAIRERLSFARFAKETVAPRLAQARRFMGRVVASLAVHYPAEHVPMAPDTTLPISTAELAAAAAQAEDTDSSLLPRELNGYFTERERRLIGLAVQATYGYIEVSQ